MKAEPLLLFPEVARGLTFSEVRDAVRDRGVDALTEARRRADDARYQDIHVKSALTRSQGMPFKWALNPYRGCTHGCAYCYARKYQAHLELGAGDDFSSVIFVKRNLPAVLARELGRRAWRRESVAVGTATDPYQPIEGHERLTRGCLEALADYETPFTLVTKGPMVVRDVDIFARAEQRAGCRVYISVPSVLDEPCARLEPGTAAPRQRLRAARQLVEAGIPVGVLMMPLVPGITTSRTSIEKTLAAIAETGAVFAGAGVARFDPGAREHFFSFLRMTYPDLVEGYERLYSRAHAPEPYTAAVRDVVSRAAHRLGPRLRRPEGPDDGG
jgi:DNA repair photolyase